MPAVFGGSEKEQSVSSDSSRGRPRGFAAWVKQLDERLTDEVAEREATDDLLADVDGRVQAHAEILDKHQVEISKLQDAVHLMSNWIKRLPVPKGRPARTTAKIEHLLSETEPKTGELGQGGTDDPKSSK